MKAARASTELSAGTSSDAALLAAWRADPDGVGGRRAVETLLGQYSRRAYGWCFRVVRDHDLALDLAQDALLSAYRALPRFREEARFSSWLFAIVRNRCRTHMHVAPLLREDDEDPDDQVSSDRGPERRFEEREELERLMTLMRQKLLPAEREALWLRCFEGLPVDEITRMLEVPGPSGARGLLQTARRKLRATLDRAGPEGGDP